MNRTRCLQMTLAAAAGTAGVGLLVAAGLAQASPSPASTAQPGRVLIHQDASTLLVLNQTPNSLVGNEFVDTWTASRGGAPAGTAATVCQALAENPDHSATFQCTATITLAGGQLTAQGVATLGEAGQQDFSLAVTGGTDSYRLVRGEVRVHFVNDTTRVLYFRLAP